jgi:hypothetical protein
VQKTGKGYTLRRSVHICEQNFNLLHPLLFESPSNPLFFDLMLLSFCQNEMQPKVGGISFCQCLYTVVAASIPTSSDTDEAAVNKVKRKNGQKGCQGRKLFLPNDRRCPHIVSIPSSSSTASMLSCDLHYFSL